MCYPYIYSFRWGLLLLFWRNGIQELFHVAWSLERARDAHCINGVRPARCKGTYLLIEWSHFALEFGWTCTELPKKAQENAIKIPFVSLSMIILTKAFLVWVDCLDQLYKNLSLLQGSCDRDNCLRFKHLWLRVRWSAINFRWLLQWAKRN